MALVVESIENLLQNVLPDPTAPYTLSQGNSNVDIPEITERLSTDETQELHWSESAGQPGWDLINDEGPRPQDVDALVLDHLAKEENGRRFHVSCELGKGSGFPETEVPVVELQLFVITPVESVRIGPV